jgi:hypothetical protein
MNSIVSFLYLKLIKKRKSRTNENTNQLEQELKLLNLELINNLDVQHRIIPRFVYPGSRLELLRNELIKEEQLIREKIIHTQNQIKETFINDA